jgi:hypothetical protein
MAGPSIFGSILSGAMDGLAVVGRSIAKNISQEREAVEVFALRVNKAAKVSEKALFSGAYRRHKKELSQYLMYEYLCSGAHQILSELSRGRARRRPEISAQVELITDSTIQAESATEMASAESVAEMASAESVAEMAGAESAAKTEIAKSAAEIDRMLDAEVDLLLQEVEVNPPQKAPLPVYKSQIELPRQLAKLVVIVVGERIISKNWQTSHC